MKNQTLISYWLGLVLLLLGAEALNAQNVYNVIWSESGRLLSPPPQFLCEGDMLRFRVQPPTIPDGDKRSLYERLREPMLTQLKEARATLQDSGFASYLKNHLGVDSNELEKSIGCIDNTAPLFIHIHYDAGDRASSDSEDVKDLVFKYDSTKDVFSDYEIQAPGRYTFSLAEVNLIEKRVQKTALDTDGAMDTLRTLSARFPNLITLLSSAASLKKVSGNPAEDSKTKAQAELILNSINDTVDKPSIYVLTKAFKTSLRTVVQNWYWYLGPKMYEWWYNTEVLGRPSIAMPQVGQKPDLPTSEKIEYWIADTNAILNKQIASARIDSLKYRIYVDICKGKNEKCDPDAFEHIVEAFKDSRKAAEDTKARLIDLQRKLSAAQVREASARISQASLEDLAKQIAAAAYLDSLNKKMLEKAVSINDNSADTRAYKELILQKASESNVRLLELQSKYATLKREMDKVATEKAAQEKPVYTTKWLYQGIFYASEKDNKCSLKPQQLTWTRRYDRLEGMLPMGHPHKAHYLNGDQVFFLIENADTGDVASLGISQEDFEEESTAYVIFGKSVNDLFEAFDGAKGLKGRIYPFGEVPKGKDVPINTPLSLEAVSELIPICEWMLQNIPKRPRTFDPAPQYVSKIVVPKVDLVPNKRNILDSMVINDTTVLIKPKELFYFDRTYHVLPIAGITLGFGDRHTSFDNASGSFKSEFHSGVRPYAGLAFHPWATRLVDPYFIYSKKRDPYPRRDWTKLFVYAAVSMQTPMEDFYFGGGLNLWSGVSVNLGYHLSRSTRPVFENGVYAGSEAFWDMRAPLRDIFIGISMDPKLFLSVSNFLSNPLNKIKP